MIVHTAFADYVAAAAILGLALGPFVSRVLFRVLNKDFIALSCEHCDLPDSSVR